MEESLSDLEGVYHNVVETLYQTFGQVLTRDIIFAIVEGCDGDMDQSANAIMNMTNEKESQPSSNVENNVEVLFDTNTLTTQSLDNNSINESNSANNMTVSGSQNRNQFGWSHDIVLSNEPQNSSSSGNMALTNVCYSRAAKIPSRPNTYTNNRINGVPRSDLNFWTSQIKQILMHHNKGTRILIIMRGIPGSGKTYLARKILEATIEGHEIDFSTHIFSADDYFLINGFYRYDKTKLQDAHIWNHTKARAAMERGVSPVIIDNTNVELWEMKSYIRDGVNNGYLIEIVEPNTPWAKKANQLSRKNIHNVPLHTIKRMLDNFQNGITAESMMIYFELSYPNDLIPPVLRNFPVVPIQSLPIENDSNPDAIAVSSVQQSEHNNTHEHVQNEEKNPNSSGSSSSDEQMQKETESLDEVLNTKEAKNAQYQYDNNLEQHTESNMQIEEYEQINKAWETNEKWEDDPAGDKRTCDENKVTGKNDDAKHSKPPRKKLNKFKRSSKDTDVENLLGKCQDWTKIDMFIQPWDENPKSDEENPVIAVEKVSNGTSMDQDDTDIYNVNKPYKKLSAVPRDINFYYMPLDKEKIPEKRMLDKSTMINEETLAEVFKGDDNKKQFTMFRNMFKHIPKSELKNIYEICHGNVQWAVSLVLEGVANNEFPREKSEDSSDSEGENFCDDNTTSKYVDDDVNKNAFDESKPSTSAKADQISDEKINNLIPNDNSQPSTSVKPDQLIENSIENVIIPPRKGKKANTSEYHINLKRQIEKNVVISENHYSKHCLKIRNQRQGIKSAVTGNESEKQVSVPSRDQSPDEELPSTSNGIVAIQSNYNIDFENGSNSDESENDFGPPEKTANINLSWEFITKLDQHFGRDNMDYPDYVLPVVNIPESLLNEINAFWMESFLDQSEAKFRESELMIQQDEAIARELEKQEFELYDAPEPKIPDLKELMDTELAQAIQNKFNSEWHKNGPLDLAAKLTLEKLNNLFPDMHPQVLSEALAAHKNNFNDTVEGLLLSTGQADILDRENGLRDFIMAKGTERREKLRKEREKELSKSEPLFLAGDKVDMKLVTRFRNEAELHLTRRNQIYQKIRDNMNHGDLRVAGYYSEIAALHTQQYDHANSLAVAALIQVGSSKNSYTATMDLHHLRVREAMEGLDLFLDSNINRLREIQKDTLTGKVKYMTLYFITGRGLHSRGRPKIKPAVQRRLTQRGVIFKERNPGLLMAKVYAAHSMTHEVA